jgi:hypothetical protein
MDAFVSSFIGAAWLGITAVLLWSVVACMRRARSQDENLPFFGMLGRQGLTVAQAEEAVGISEVSRAVRRCVLCRSNEACRAEFAGSQPASHDPDCPNAGVLERARR